MLDGSILRTSLTCLEITVSELMSSYLKDQYDRQYITLVLYSICNILADEFIKTKPNNNKKNEKIINHKNIHYNVDKINIGSSVITSNESSSGKINNTNDFFHFSGLGINNRKSSPENDKILTGLSSKDNSQRLVDRIDFSLGNYQPKNI